MQIIPNARSLAKEGELNRRSRMERFTNGPES